VLLDDRSLLIDVHCRWSSASPGACPPAGGGALDEPAPRGCVMCPLVVDSTQGCWSVLKTIGIHSGTPVLGQQCPLQGLHKGPAHAAPSSSSRRSAWAWYLSSLCFQLVHAQFHQRSCSSAPPILSRGAFLVCLLSLFACLSKRRRPDAKSSGSSTAPPHRNWQS
jgi:hypothetical protein